MKEHAYDWLYCKSNILRYFVRLGESLSISGFPQTLKNDFLRHLHDHFSNFHLASQILGSQHFAEKGLSMTVTKFRDFLPIIYTRVKIRFIFVGTSRAPSLRNLGALVGTCGPCCRNVSILFNWSILSILELAN